MSTNQTLDPPEKTSWEMDQNSLNRSAFKQRLAETERGFTTCFRANSSLFLYFFTTCIVVCMAIVLGLTGLQWALLSLSITLALSSEILYFSIHTMMSESGQGLPENIRQLLSMAKAAFMLLLAGSVLTIIILLAARCLELYLP